MKSFREATLATIVVILAAGIVVAGVLSLNFFMEVGHDLAGTPGEIAAAATFVFAVLTLIFAGTDVGSPDQN